MKRGKIDADYSRFPVSKANTLEIIADYTKSKVEIAEDVTYNCDYGGITLDKVKPHHLLGKEVISTQETSQINVNHIPPRMYLLKVFSENGYVVKQVIIK